MRLPALTIARLTILEAARRRLLLALLILTLVTIALTGWGFQRLTVVTDRAGQPLPDVQVRLIASQLLILVAFMFSGVLALSSAVVAGPAIANDVESGLVLALLARPLRRSEVVLGKWFGLAFLVTGYAAAAGSLEMLIVYWTTGYAVPHPIETLALVAAEGITLLTLGLLFSTRFSGITGAVVAVMAFLMAWIGGIVGNIGSALQNQSIAQVGTISHLLLPTDGLWRGAVYYMEPAPVITLARAAGPGFAANPFVSAYPPELVYLAWALAWIAGVLLLAVWSFRRREV
ncbi:MAG TPA: ABC transporter permease subunit [Candidatus Acidoferrales bacterium]|nr:ABC transporter permease subunit [Candidatus Acidoferrales bacterium]